LRVSSAESLVGREAELALAASEVSHLSEGRASVLAIEGEAGIGKTCPVQSIIDDARSRDMVVFCGQAHPFERTRPFGVVAAALDLNRRSPDPRRAAIGALLGGRSAGARTAGDIQYRVVEEIVELVETSCAERPVLLVAEDIHWADSASLLAILSVARQLPLAALLVVVTARPSPLPAEAARLLDDLADGGARTLHLQPLTSDDLAVLASHVLGATPGPALTTMLAKAGGNPLWAVAMLRSLGAEGMLRSAGDSVEVTTSELPASLATWWFAACATCRRQRLSCCRSRRRSVMQYRFAMSLLSPADGRPMWSGSSATRSMLSFSTKMTNGSCSGTGLCTTRSISTCRRPPAAFSTVRPRSR
jgi:predicted ATPase